MAFTIALGGGYSATAVVVEQAAVVATAVV